MRSRLSYANVVSTLALFLVLGGGAAYAGAQLAKNSVGTRQLKKGAVTAAKVKPGSLLASSFKAGQLPQGPPGPEGPRGPDGRQGEKGDPGSSSVIFSKWVKATPASTETIDGTLSRRATISAPNLTSTVLGNASVSVYFRVATLYYQLPYRSESSEKMSTLFYALAPGTITILRTTDGCKTETCLVALSELLEYRYVIVPGGRAAG